MSSKTVSRSAPDGTAFDFEGPEGAPVICLIHGLGLSREVWAHHVPDFSQSHRVLNYDLYGHGQSQPSPQEASLAVYSNQLAGLMDFLDIEKATVIGFSIGGMINRRFAMDHRERLNDLVILNSPHNRGDDAQNAVEARALKVREQGAFSTFDEALKRWFTPDHLSKGDGAHNVREWREQVDPESYAQATWVLANGVRELINPDPPIKAPTLVMTCENDTGSTPQMSRDIAEEIEGSRVMIVPHLQHLGLMENATVFTQPILEFIERSPR